MTKISARRAEVLASYGIKQKKVKKKKEPNDDLPVYAPIRMRRELEKVDKVTAIRKAKDDWIIMQTDRVNDGVCGATGSNVA